MGKQTTLMAIPRHPEVPAPSVEEILRAVPKGVYPTYGRGTFLMTTLGIVHLPIPFDTQTWIGVGIGAFAGLLGATTGSGVAKAMVEETGKAIGETVQERNILPDRIQASLRRRTSFFAGYAEVVRVVHNAVRWVGTDSIVVDISKAGQLTSHTVNFAQELKHEHTAEAAEYIAVYRVLAEGVWAWEDAMFSLEPMSTSIKPPRLLATENPLTDLADRARSSGLKRDQVVRRAIDRHPSFVQFQHCAATAETFDVFMRSFFLPD